MLNAVTQVLTTTGECAGAGFAIYPKGMIVTCAHVVNAALGHNATKAEQPTQTVLLTFLGTKQTSSAEIVAWSPYEQHDVAILKIQDELPKQIKPILLFDISDLRDCAFRVYGFPRRVGYTSGRYAQGQLTAFLPTGKLQAHSLELRPGDSGGFVQELQMGRVVGMVSSVDETEATAFIIPAPLIALVCEQVQLNRVLYPFSPLTDGLVGLPGNPLTGVEDFLVEYLGTSTRPAPFGGRQTELDALDTWLADSSKPYALITQPAGRGKSALLTRWIAKVVAEDRSDITFVPISQRFDTALRSRCFSLLGARLRYLCATDTAISLTTAPDLWLSEIDQYLRTDREGERPLLVVLDGLDEAADWEAGHDLRFPQRPGRGVKLIVSARLIHDDQDESGWLRRLRWSRGVQTISVDPLDQVGMADVLQAMGNPLDRLAGQVDIVKELYHLTQGDPLLTRLYVEALLEQGGNAAFLAPKDLQAITPGLSGYFDAWFEAQDRLWRQQGRETLRERAAVMCFLNLLACALGPIEREDVAAIARTPLNEAHRLEDTRRVVARFVLGDGVKRGFVFSHPQLALYFYNQMLATEQNEWHSRFLVYGQQILDKLNKGQTKPQNVSSYIVQYYGAHLEQSEAASDELLYSLVSEGWLRAWEALESVQSGFLHDVDRAWRQAIQKRNIGLQVRCALCHSSIVTLSSNLPIWFIIACLDASVISSAQALQFVQNQPDSSIRSEQLLAIIPKLDEEQRRLAVQEALTAILAMSEDNHQEQIFRARAITALAPHIPLHLLEQTLLTVLGSLASNNHEDTPWLEPLRALIPTLSSHLLEKVLTDILVSPMMKGLGHNLRADILIALAPHLPHHLLPQALNAALKLPLEGIRAEALTALFPHLLESQRLDIVDRVLSTVLALPIKDKSGRRPQAEALTALLPHLPEPQRSNVLSKALEATSALPMEEHRLLTERDRKEDGSRIEALSALAAHLSVHQLQSALNTILNLGGDAVWERPPQVEAFITLALHLPEPDRSHILQMALNTVLGLPTSNAFGDSLRAEALTLLLPYLPDHLLENALNNLLDLLTMGTFENIHRAKELAALAPHLPSHLRNRLENTILDSHLLNRLESAILDPYRENFLGNYSLVEALMALAPLLPEPERSTIFSIALNLPLVFSGGSDSGGGSRIQVLKAMVSYLPPDLLQEVLNTILALPMGGMRAGSPKVEAVKILAPHLPERQRTHILEHMLVSLKRIGDQWKGVDLLSLSIPHPPPYLLDEMLQTALALPAEERGDNPRTETLMTIAPHLSTHLLEKLLRATLALPIQNGLGLSPRAEALITLAPHLTPLLLEEALQAALLFPVQDSLGRSPRVEALIKLALRLPESQRLKIINIARKTIFALAVKGVLGQSPQAAVIISLAAYLPPDLLKEVLQAALTLPVKLSADNNPQAEAIIALAPHLPDPQRSPILRMALLAALDFPVQGGLGRSPRAEALVALAPHLTAPQYSDMLEIALNAAFALPLVSDWKSSPCAEALTALAPYLPELQRLEVLHIALKSIFAPVNGGWRNSPRAKTLSTLAPHLPPQMLEMALQTVLDLPLKGDYGDNPRLEALTALISHLPLHLRKKALNAVPILGEGGLKDIIHSEPLVRLLPYLPEPQRTNMFKAALDATLDLPVTGVKGESPMLQALIMLAPYVSDKTCEQFKITVAHVLQRNAQLPRPKLLDYLKSLFKNGQLWITQEEYVEIYKAVRDVTIWWP